MARRARLDAELVRRGFARSREHAARLVRSGRVTVSGLPVGKVATNVDPAAAVAVLADRNGPDWASRGAYKLLGALDRFSSGGLTVAGLRCLDAGASTGGFTDVLLDRGAVEVVAVDVGYGLLDWRLRSDPRVRVHDRTNVRALCAESIGGTVGLAVVDLSFISLRLVLPALRSCTAPGADLLVLIKPQFEVGRDRLGARGVVRDPAARRAAVYEAITAAAREGLAARDVVASPLPGPAGNVEYFAWFVHGGDVPYPPETLVRAAVQDGPQ